MWTCHPAFERGAFAWRFFFVFQPPGLVLLQTLIFFTNFFLPQEYTYQSLNNNNNNRISIAPYGRNFRDAGGRSDQCSVKAWLNRTVLSLDLKLRIMEVAVTTGAIRRATKLQSNHHHQQTNTQIFTGRMAFLSPYQVSEHRREDHAYHTSKNMSIRFLLYLKAAWSWTNLRNFWHTHILIFQASKRMQLSCVATPPENALATKQASCFPPRGWLQKDHEWRDQLTTNEFQYSSKFHLLTDVSVVLLPDWTQGHQQHHILCSTHSSWTAAHCTPGNWTGVLINRSLHRLCSSQFLLEILSPTFCAVYPLIRHKILIKIYYLLYIKWHVYKHSRNVR